MTMKTTTAGWAHFVAALACVYLPLAAADEPPQLRTEGISLASEQLFLEEILMPVIRDGNYDMALELLRDRYDDDMLTLLEAGDPLELVAGRVVAGNTIGGGGAVSSTMLYLIGHVYLTLEQFVPAETAFRYALRPLPDYLRAHESLGLLYLRTERFDEARVHLSRAAELGLRTTNLFGALGYLNQETGNYWGAVAAYQQAMMMQPDNEQWQRGLMYSLSETHQTDSLLTLVEQMLQERANDANLWLIRAHAALQNGDREDALASLETVIRLGEISPSNLQVGAQLHMELGSLSRAVTLLRGGFIQGLEFEFIEQAMTWLQQNGEWDYLDELVGYLRDGDESLSPAQRSRLMSAEAAVELNAGDSRSARTVLEQALELDPGNANALMTLAGIRSADGNYGQAELLYQRATAYPRYVDNASIMLAQLAIDQENFERALVLLRGVAQRNPGFIEIRRNIDSLENLLLLQDQN
jgi:tetratricopeptide (TPR) repeat protein